mmetsp:Transcript_47885/g.147736  ORF Transcript_47885/g.147736 Transcript_47885/m.147736 type:complete len:202 (-) Transcript_47885:825-1430(-)
MSRRPARPHRPRPPNFRRPNSLRRSTLPPPRRRIRISPVCCQPFRTRRPPRRCRGPCRMPLQCTAWVPRWPRRSPCLRLRWDRGRPCLRWRRRSPDRRRRRHRPSPRATFRRGCRCHRLPEPTATRRTAVRGELGTTRPPHPRSLSRALFFNGSSTDVPLITMFSLVFSSDGCRCFHDRSAVHASFGTPGMHGLRPQLWQF